MRVLVAAERLGSAGGMERYLDVLLPKLVARGATVHVLARRIDPSSHGNGDGAGVVAEQVPWAEEHDAPSLAARAAVRDAIAAFAPDVAVAHNVMDAGVVEALRAAKRLVYHVHDHRPFCPNGDRVFPRTGRICIEPLGRACTIHSLTDGCAYGPRRRTARLIRSRERLRDAVGAADAVVVASRYVAERARDSGVDERRIVEITPPLPDDAYAAADVLPGRSRDVVFAGRIVPQKGLDTLVRAVATLPPERRPRVRAFGDGPVRDDVAAEAARLGVTLDAPGAVDAAVLRAALDEAALLALPSRWAEPFGYVGIEAFARARPVVAFDAGGVRTWLQPGHNGVAVAPGDEVALGAALGALLDDDARRARLGRNARGDAERYRASTIVDALARTYGFG
ncbi:MAG TPA: glycosyltransferase family 4 protein [Candidatus Elarobacter sp.]|jgi:glycosyltransferase involved in cell wall biosynthesis|nr:glycosyltransferase family 4 protein [Candidatus Elarobacter sp.]